MASILSRPQCVNPVRRQSKPLLTHKLDPLEQTSVRFESNYEKCLCGWKCLLQNTSHFSSSNVLSSHFNKFWSFWNPVSAIINLSELTLPGFFQLNSVGTNPYVDPWAFNVRTWGSILSAAVHDVFLTLVVTWPRCFLHLLITESLVWGLLNQFPKFRDFISLFRMIKTLVTCSIPGSYLAGVTHHSLAAETSGKYERDSKGPTYHLRKKIKIFINDGSFSNPHP